MEGWIINPQSSIFRGSWGMDLELFRDREFISGVVWINKIHLFGSECGAWE